MEPQADTLTIEEFQRQLTQEAKDTIWQALQKIKLQWTVEDMRTLPQGSLYWAGWG